MKLHILLTVALVVCVGSFATAGKKYSIDQFTDGDNRSDQKGWWYVYDDTGKGGNSSVKPSKGLLKIHKGKESQGNVAKIKGTTGDKFAYPYIGMGVTLSEKSGCPAAEPVDMSKYKKLQFKVKGMAVGGKLTVVLLHTDKSCDKMVPKTLTGWADFQTDITSKMSNKWTTITLDLRKDFAQPFWGKPEHRVSIEKVLKNAHLVHWNYSGPAGSTLNMQIDDIVFY